VLGILEMFIDAVVNAITGWLLWLRDPNIGERHRPREEHRHERKHEKRRLGQASVA
jgi:hypothetical protein